MIKNSLEDILGVSKEEAELLKKVDQKREEYPDDFFNSNKNYTAKPLLTNNELKLFSHLIEWFDKHYWIFPQVSLRSIIATPKFRNTSKELYRTIDFVIFNTDFHPILAIELNGKEHLKDPYTINRDISNIKILQKAQIPIMILWNEDISKPKKIYKTIKTKLKEIENE